MWGLCKKVYRYSSGFNCTCWISSLHSGFEVCTVFFDLRKAFDNVSHQFLMEKVVKLELPSPMLQWLREYLAGCFQQVSVAGTTSTLHPVLSGVPQGSLLVHSCLYFT